DLASAHGKRALPLLYQGVTTVVFGVDGAGNNEVRAGFERFRQEGIAVNAVRYVGHGAARGAVMGVAGRHRHWPAGRCRGNVDSAGAENTHSPEFVTFTVC
ncbi:MAG: hypothetical protein ACREMA_18630, partial [Longimicrobiales bacterium]